MNSQLNCSLLNESRPYEQLCWRQEAVIWSQSWDIFCYQYENIISTLAPPIEWILNYTIHYQMGIVQLNNFAEDWIVLSGVVQKLLLELFAVYSVHDATTCVTFLVQKKLRKWSRWCTEYTRVGALFWQAFFDNFFWLFWEFFNVYGRRKSRSSNTTNTRIDLIKISMIFSHFSETRVLSALARPLLG